MIITAAKSGIYVGFAAKSFLAVPVAAISAASPVKLCTLERIFGKVPLVLFRFARTSVANFVPIPAALDPAPLSASPAMIAGFSLIFAASPIAAIVAAERSAVLAAPMRVLAVSTSVVAPPGSLFAMARISFLAA